MTEKTYRCLGIMTGNSLDAIDIVVTEFCNREIRDIGFFSQEFPRQMAQRFRAVKRFLAENDGDIEAAIAHPQLALDSLIDDYTSAVAAAVNNALQTNCIPAASVDAIGFHGQTCAHCPPSVSTADTYTLQVGNGQMLADLTGIPVIFDFRSDDLMNGGEGAPFAPAHNLHLAYSLRQRGIFPVAFCNGGNTGNIAVISARTQKGKAGVCGFDTGPFNHFVDYLARTEQNLPCDLDGGCGRLGKINYSLLRELFNKAAVTRNGRNFILRKPPKSSDPAWYKIIPALTNPATSFADRIRTAEFFSAYIFVYALKHLPGSMLAPQHFLLFGGGWHNPLILEDFKRLLSGDAGVLPEHEQIFRRVANPQAEVVWSDAYGLNSQYMEARIFADMAKCKLTGEPFSFPRTTGCSSPTVGGIIARPGENNRHRWSRAAKGWQLQNKKPF